MLSRVYMAQHYLQITNKSKKIQVLPERPGCWLQFNFSIDVRSGGWHLSETSTRGSMADTLAILLISISILDTFLENVEVFVPFLVLVEKI